MDTVLITGVGGPAGRNLAALFGARGVAVIGVDMQPLTACDFPFYKVVAAQHPDYLAQLQKLIVLHRVGTVIPTVSEELPLMAAKASQLSAEVVIGSYEAVAAAHDKYLTYVQLVWAGVNVPASALPSDLVGEVGPLLGLPFLSKPRVGRGGRGVVVHTAEATGLGDDLLLQAFAPGTEYTVNLYRRAPGNVARSAADSAADGGADEVVVVLEKLELRDGQVGNAVRVRRADAPDVAAVALKAARSLGLSGVIDMDVRRAADGTPLLLEVNARVGANIGAAPEVFEALFRDMEARTWARSLSFSI